MLMLMLIMAVVKVRDCWHQLPALVSPPSRVGRLSLYPVQYDDVKILRQSRQILRSKQKLSFIRSACGLTRYHSNSFCYHFRLLIDV